MKTMKKIAIFMMAMCLMVSCFVMPAQAANGKIMFTDPSGKVGEEIEVKGVVQRTDGTGYGKMQITMLYDTSALQFVSGTGITEPQSGVIVYVGDATNQAGARHEFTFKFKALKEGTTKVEVSAAIVRAVSGAVLNYTKGISTFTILPSGEAVTPDNPATEEAEKKLVEVGGKQYTLSNEIPEAEIPLGYQKTTIDYDFGTYNVIYNVDTEIYLAYLIAEDNMGKFFMYIEDDATFAPFEQIAISEGVTITLLSDTTGIELPKEYKKSSVVLNEQEFPAWHNTKETDFYIIYAMNSYGDKNLYRLDNAEGTYQRFEAPEVVKEPEGKSGFVGKLESLLENHLDWVIIGGGFGFLIAIVVIVILGVKLYNRNVELDEIYDEYDIDPDDEEDAEEEEEDEDTEEVVAIDDIVLDLGDIAEAEEESAEQETGADFFMQEGLKELFPENTKEEESIQSEKEVEEALSGLFAEELAKAKAESEQADEEDIFENFSIDFIDLDD